MVLQCTCWALLQFVGQYGNLVTGRASTTKLSETRLKLWFMLVLWWLFGQDQFVSYRTLHSGATGPVGRRHEVHSFMCASCSGSADTPGTTATTSTHGGRNSASRPATSTSTEWRGCKRPRGRCVTRKDGVVAVLWAEGFSFEYWLFRVVVALEDPVLSKDLCRTSCGRLLRNPSYDAHPPCNLAWIRLD